MAIDLDSVLATLLGIIACILFLIGSDSAMPCLVAAIFFELCSIKVQIKRRGNA